MSSVGSSLLWLVRDISPCVQLHTVYVVSFSYRTPAHWIRATPVVISCTFVCACACMCVSQAQFPREVISDVDGEVGRGVGQPGTGELDRLPFYPESL